MKGALILILFVVLLPGQKCPAQSAPSGAPMLIESVMVNGQAVAVPERSATVNVVARQDQLEINYAVIGMTGPGAGPFRYRMNGLYADWHNAGTNRVAQFSNLSPGRYEFTVQSARRDGTWDEKGAMLLVTVSPGLGVRLLFPLAVLVAVLLLGGVVYFMTHRRREGKNLTT